MEKPKEKTPTAEVEYKQKKQVFFHWLYGQGKEKTSRRDGAKIGKEGRQKVPTKTDLLKNALDKVGSSQVFSIF